MLKRGVRGQVAVEYLMVLGMALVLLLPGAYLFYQSSQGNKDKLVASQVNRAGADILSAVDAMYAVGQNSWTTVTINFPESVINVFILGYEELVVEYDTQSGISQLVFFSLINITAPYNGNISQSFQPGITKIKVASMGSYVEISEIIQ